MINRHLYNGLSWLDIEKPTAADIETVLEEYGVDPLICNELLTPTARPKVELYKNYIYLVLHFPATSNHTTRNQEIDFVIGKDFIVTTRYSSVEALENFAKVFEVKATLNKKDLGNHAGYVFFHLIRTLYESLVDELEVIENKLHQIETEIFNGRERPMVEALSHISRQLLDFKKATVLHHEMLSSLEYATSKIFDAAFQYYVRAIIGEYLKVESAIKANIESSKELRDTNSNLLQTKQNEVMKNFTILAFITFPFSLLVAVMSLESPGNPFKNGTLTFWPIVFILALLMGGMYFYFKHRKWL